MSGFSAAILEGIFIGLVLGSIGFLLWRRNWVRTQRGLHEEKCASLKRDYEIQLREEKSRLELEFERKRMGLEEALGKREMLLKSKEDEVSSLLLSAEKERDIAISRKNKFDDQIEAIEAAEENLRTLTSEYKRRLLDISDFTPQQAREQILSEVQRECEDEVRVMKQELLDKSESEIKEEAQRILIASMQRLSSAPQNDINATVVPIPSEDMKGRIIGREGRNIKSFETLTGTTLLIDETPESVLISSFDPVRREIARIALEQLIRDGRIHPASIEDAVHTAEDEVKQSVLQSGEDALRRLRLTKMHPEVLAAVGRLRFRLANNQNALEHSIEVANLCALMASELGLDPIVAKRGGLLHDIGKVLDEESEGSHALAGSFFIKRYGDEDARVVNAVAAHHEEVPAESPYAGLVMIADSLSAMRPGARAESLDGYLQRVRTLEAIAKEENGVEEAFAIQAGREVRILVSPQSISESEAPILAKRVRRKIEDEMQYPGTIRITVIRENRFTEVAK